MNNRLLIFENSDKVDTTSPFNPRNLCDLPTPFCAILSAPTSSGKTSLIQNIILQQQPEFDRILLWHFDEFSSEYDSLDVEKIESAPNVSMFKRGEKTLLIIEDISFDALNKQEKSDLNRCFGYISSHYGVSILLTTQTYTNVPVPIRRMANFLFLWKATDRRLSYLLSAMFGINKKRVDEYFDTLETRYDFICISSAVGYPRITKNIYEVLSED
jgi:hypothetical protein